jgi:hypothetical protein
MLRLLIDLALFMAVMALLLGPVHAFLSYRLRRARRRGGDRAYVALADPWLVPVVGLAGLALNALLWALLPVLR